MVKRILVCGGRNYGAYDRDTRDWKTPTAKAEHKYILRTLDKLSEEWPKLPKDKYGNWLPNVFIIAGGADGADTAAIDWAITRWCQFKEYKADWSRYGKSAGPRRNQIMLEEGKPDLVVAFPGASGTADMVRRAVEAGIDVFEIDREKPDGRSRLKS